MENIEIIVLPDYHTTIFYTDYSKKLWLIETYPEEYKYLINKPFKFGNEVYIWYKGSSYHEYSKKEYNELIDLYKRDNFNNEFINYL